MRTERMELEIRLAEMVDQNEEAFELAAAQMNEAGETAELAEELGVCCEALGGWVAEICETQGVRVPKGLVDWLETIDYSIVPKGAQLRKLTHQTEPPQVTKLS